jgi:acetoin utilization deacetylase AcuC-like enzyme
MPKYRMVREALERDPAMAGAVFRVAPLAAREDVVLVHDARYFDRFAAGRVSERETRAVGFPWSPAGVRRALASTGGTVAATRALLAEPRMRISGQVAGGTHHAFAGHGSGFCWFSDIAVAAAVALKEFRLRRVLIVDLDVHQGDGNAKVCTVLRDGVLACF